MRSNAVTTRATAAIAIPKPSPPDATGSHNPCPSRRGEPHGCTQRRRGALRTGLRAERSVASALTGLRAVVLAGVMLSAGSAAFGQAGAYLHDDARISGSQVYAFQDAGRTVTMVLGDFRLALAGRVVTARNGVLWVQTDQQGGVTRHTLTVYAEGDATVREPDGPVTRDAAMLITVRLQGRVLTTNVLPGESLKQYPLYERAAAFREAARAVPPRGQPPLLIRRATPPPPPAPGPSAAPDGPAAAPDAATPEAPAPVPPPPPDAVESDTPVEPVYFHAGQVVSEPLAPEDPNGPERGAVQRVVVARENVYLSQGNPDSDLFLEVRAQRAVIFTARRPPTEGGGPPTTPDVGGVGTDLPTADPNQDDWEETIVGAYLEGDVVIARGERYLRGERAYYDFVANRALMPHAVFRTRQEQRNIPIFIRAEEARLLSARELWFRDARLSSSDFYTPTYHIGVAELYVMDQTPYDAKGMQIGERSYQAEMKHTTFNVRTLPLLYLPYQAGDLTDTDVPLRSLQMGKDGEFGFGVESRWHLFRLLGLVQPKGFKAYLDADFYERGLMLGASNRYARDTFTGYDLIYGMWDRKQKDTFGEDREDIAAPDTRGRFLARHKHFLPNNWQLQLEASYVCDENFLEEFFNSEFWSGKEQETLAYAKKQEENWAFTSLLKVRLNDWQSQAESMPDLGFHVIGESVADDLLTLYSESHAGLKRFRPGDDDDDPSSRIFARGDTRNEVDFPLHFGPLNVMPYAVGRATYWDDARPQGEKCRPYGQLGVRANTHLWRIYDGVESRLFDVHGLRHILTPELDAFTSCAGGVTPDELFPLDPDIEQYIERKSGVALRLLQRWQTKRGTPGALRTVDWMRLDVTAAWYDADSEDDLPGDGRFFFSRPEHSIARDHVNVDYAWNVSDATTLLFDTNYDMRSGNLERINGGIAVRRDPRLSYFLGVRAIDEMDTVIATAGASYQVNRKYTLSAFQQYDFDWKSGWNHASSLTIVRKWPRWYTAFTVSYSETNDQFDFLITVWPEGVPEFHLGGNALSVFEPSGLN